MLGPDGDTLEGQDGGEEIEQKEAVNHQAKNMERLEALKAKQGK